MKPSGLNSIEYVLNFILGLWKVIGYVLLTAIVGPVLYLLWVWNTTTYQARTIEALNAAPILEQITFNFNGTMQCSDGKVAGQIVFPFSATPAERPMDQMPSFLAKFLPWAPALPKDPLHPLAPLTEDDQSRGTMEPISLDSYRLPHGVPHADPWYRYGLFKLAPGKHWDCGTGPDYAFGKCAGNYLAYVGAVRAVATMRNLLGARAIGAPKEELDLLPLRSASLYLQNPIVVFFALSEHTAPGAGRAFLNAYATNFNNKLPNIELDLQPFMEAMWYYQPDLKAMKHSNEGGSDWQNRMGWWPGFIPNGSSAPPDTTDIYITGLRVAGQSNLLGRPQFTVLDFFWNHLPATTSSEAKARGALTRMTTDAFWDGVLPADPVTREAAHTLLADLRRDLAFDYQFARKYGSYVYDGSAMDRSIAIIER